MQREAHTRGLLFESELRALYSTTLPGEGGDPNPPMKSLDDEQFYQSGINILHGVDIDWGEGTANSLGLTGMCA